MLFRSRGWHDVSNSCSQRYQTSNFHIEARFATNATNSFVVDVTRLLRTGLRSSNTSVAQIGSGSSSVIGRRSGQTVVDCIYGGNLGNITVTVSDAVVSIFALVVNPVVSLGLSGLPSSAVTSFSTFTATASVLSQMTSEFQTAPVFVFAALSDGRSTPLLDG